MPYANNKGTDQPAHPRSLISAIVVRCLDSVIPTRCSKHRAHFRIALLYFCLFANLNEDFYTLTIKRPKYSTVFYKRWEN